MKTIKILVLVSILAVTQSFAFSKSQKNILLGIGAGALIIHALESHNKIVYVDSRYSHPKHKKHHMKKHHMKKRYTRKHHRGGHHHYSRANHHNKHYNRNYHRRGYNRY